MARTAAEAAAVARAARTEATRALMAEYARDWADKPVYRAVNHFQVNRRTITRWRAALGLADGRRDDWHARRAGGSRDR